MLISIKSSISQRVRWVDYAKGVGIFLVVLGHTLRGLVNHSILELSMPVRAIDEWIYAFHMPLFFFISGLFINRSASRPLRVFVVEKLKAIAYPYVLWSVLQSILQATMSSYTTNHVSLTSLWQIVYSPVMQFWFLYTLLVITLVYAITCKLHVSPLLFLVLSIFFYCSQEYVSLGDWGVLYLVRRYAIYLALGAVVGNSRVISELPRLKTSLLIVAIFGGFLTVGAAVGFNFINQSLVIPVVAMFGIFATVALAILLEQLNVAGFLEQWGHLSLAIFVAHTIASSILRIGLQKLLGFEQPLAHLVLGIAVGIYAPIALAIICQRIGFQYMFTLDLRIHNQSKPFPEFKKT